MTVDSQPLIADTEMRNKGKLDDIKPMRDRLEVCHVEVVRHRKSEMEGGPDGNKGAASDIKKKWPNAKPVVVTTFSEHEPSIRIFTLDAAETVKQSPAGTFTVEEVDKWVREEYGKSDGSDPKKAKNHFSVIQEHRATMKTERDLLKGIC
jgi:hypothetical protein